MIEKLIKLADFLDEQGAHEEAEVLDGLVKKLAPVLHEGGEEAMSNNNDVNTIALAPMFDDLTNIADKLDDFGLPKGADMIDGFLQKHADVVDWKEEADTEQSKRYDSEYHHKLQVREPKREQERIDREHRKNHHIHTYQHVAAENLGTRYCPNHRGVQMGRVGERTYQCPLDGKTYNWETGFVDVDGNQWPGGSVAQQTPSATEYAVPHRVYDSRENILNTIN